MPPLTVILEEMKLKLKHSDKQVIVEKFMDLTNLTFGGLTLAQAFLESRKSLFFVFLGVFALLLGYSLAIIILRKKRLI